MSSWSLRGWHGRDRRKESWFGCPFFSAEAGADFPASQDGVEDDETDALALALARAPLHWRDTRNAHVFRAHIPGLKKEEVKVQVEDGNILQISGERRMEHELDNGSCHRVERQRGSFVRRFRLPENANAEGIECGVDNGVLTVTVPKRDHT